MTEGLNDTNSVLAKKRDWRKAERRVEERRKKYGTTEERKDTADALRAGRQQTKCLKFCTCSMCESGFNRRPFWFNILRKIGILSIFLLLCGPVHAYTTHDAVLSVIGEAENQGDGGMLALSCAIKNRGTLRGVYGLHSPRVRHHRYSEAIYLQAVQAWDEANEPADHCGQIAGAQYWGSTMVDQKWIAKMQAAGYVHTATIGQQAFFRKN